MVFGGVLILGALALVPHTYGRVVHDRDGLPAAALVPMIWLAALALGLAARALVSRRPHLPAMARASVVLPSIGVALLGPLTLQLAPIMFLFSRPFAMFDQWVWLAVIVSAPAHLLFAVLAAWRADQLARGVAAISPRRIYAWVVVVSCVPFVALYGLPPLAVAVTGLPFLWWMRVVDRIVDAERVAAELPHAAVVAPA